MFKVKSYVKGHPNPMCYREKYVMLNGTWDFILDYKKNGFKKGYIDNFKKEYEIKVPYCYLSEKSNVNIKNRCDRVWYRKEFIINKDNTKDYILHLEGADQKISAFLNKNYIGSDFGAYHRMSFNLTEYLTDGTNELIIVCDDSMSITQPRGKQRFLKKNFMCWYEETTGIYKDVWIEELSKNRILDFKFTPNFKEKKIVIDGLTTNEGDVSISVSYKEEVVSIIKVHSDCEFTASIDLSKEFHPWETLKPELYDVELKFDNDKVLSYFGIRCIETKNNKILLNGKELYQKLILDQGYIEGGDLTLTHEELEKDIKDIIDLGFNGARKHQKRESDVFYSLADFYGLLLWSEMPSMYYLNNKSKYLFTKEWISIIQELYNHPSIICLTPFNESWGIFGIDRFNRKCSKFVKFIVDLTKDMDKTRLVQSNDGWSHLCSDIITIHNYAQDSIGLKNAIDDAINKNKIHFLTGRKLTKDGLMNKPIMVSEFGGISNFSNSNDSWGYGKNLKDEEYYNKLKELFDCLLDDKRIVGYCYTQLSDVKQEMNGLLSLDRKLKIDYKKMKDINRS